MKGNRGVWVSLKEGGGVKMERRRIRRVWSETDREGSETSGRWFRSRYGIEREKGGGCVALEILTLSPRFARI
jgi:hypothetical protein